MLVSRKISEVADAVVQQAATRPADAVLRQVLRSAELSPEDKHEITYVVFAYFRWYGWLNHSESPQSRFEQATELQQSFLEQPQSFTPADLLARSVPAWIHEHVSLAPETLREWQGKPRLWLRARPGTAETVGRVLEHCRIHSTVPDALEYRGQEDLYRSRGFREGMFEIQDLSSQIVGHLCSPAVGSTWWDACAGEGGKTLHLSDLMQGKGMLWATDRAEWRLKILKQRAARAKVFNYRVKIWKELEHLPIRTKFDGILVDAPCSGVGTWGRNPHARWTLTSNDVAELAALQQRILNRVVELLKPGGLLVYSVCTLTRIETDAVADWFDDTFKNFNPRPVALPGLTGSARHRLLPHVFHANGMYVALWQKAI